MHLDMSALPLTLKNVLAEVRLQGPELRDKVSKVSR